MAETTLATKKYILKYGLILGLIWILHMTFRHITDTRNTSNIVFSIIELLVHIGVISYGIFSFKRKNNGFLTLWQAVKVGLGIALFSAIMQAVWDIAILQSISPDFIQDLMNSSDSANLNQVQEQQKQLVSKNKSKFTVASLIIKAILGAIISLLARAIMQKNPDPFE